MQISRIVQLIKKIFLIVGCKFEKIPYFLIINLPA